MSEMGEPSVNGKLTNLGNLLYSQYPSLEVRRRRVLCSCPPAVLQLISVHLRFDVDFLNRILLEPSDIYLAVKVANVANDSVLWHIHEMLTEYNIFASGCRDIYLSFGRCLFHCCYLRSSFAPITILQKESSIGGLLAFRV